MAENVTKQEVQDIVNTAVNKAVADLSEVIASFAQSVDERFNKVESDIADIKTDIVDLKASHERLMNTLDAFLKRLDDIENDNNARDAQLARLERWIEQIAHKTGVKLEY